MALGEGDEVWRGKSSDRGDTGDVGGDVWTHTLHQVTSLGTVSQTVVLGADSLQPAHSRGALKRAREA